MNNSGSVKGTGIAWVVFAAFAISVSVVIASIAFSHGTSTLTILLLRFLALMMLIPLLMRARRLTLRVAPRAALLSVVIGAIFLAQTGGYLASVSYIPVALAVLLFYTYPLLTAMLGAFIDRRRPHPLELLGLGMAFAGLFLALQVSFDALDARGIGFAALAACAAAVVLNSTQRVLRNLASLPVSFFTSVGSLLVCIVILALGGEVAWPDTDIGWWALVASVTTFAIFYPTMIIGIERVGAVPAALIFNLEPPFTILLAAWWLDQTLTLTQLFGAAVGVAAVCIGQIPHLRRNPENPG